MRDFVRAPGMRPAGRLDHDSEGLVLLTGLGALQSRLADPRWKTDKRYFVQVEGEPDEAALSRLRSGVALNDGPTLPASAELIEEPGWLWPRDPPIRFRKAISGGGRPAARANPPLNTRIEDLVVAVPNQELQCAQSHRRRVC